MEGRPNSEHDLKRSNTSKKKYKQRSRSKRKNSESDLDSPRRRYLFFII